MKRAKILVIEGTDGSGKETQSKRLEERLLNQGYKVKRYSFPIYDSPTGRIVGGPFLGKPEYGGGYFPETSANVDPLVSSVYYAADRRYNFLDYLENDLYENDIINLDRYTTSNMGFQAAKGKTKEERNRILDFIEDIEYGWYQLPRPDKVLFLHLPCEAAKELRKGRPAGDGNEDNDEYLKHAEQTYLEIAEKYKWRYINCLKAPKFEKLEDIRTIEEIGAEIDGIVEEFMQEETPAIQRLTRFMGGN